MVRLECSLCPEIFENESHTGPGRPPADSAIWMQYQTHLNNIHPDPTRKMHPVPSDRPDPPRKPAAKPNIPTPTPFTPSV